MKCARVPQMYRVGREWVELYTLFCNFNVFRILKDLKSISPSHERLIPELTLVCDSYCRFEKRKENMLHGQKYLVVQMKLVKAEQVHGYTFL